MYDLILLSQHKQYSRAISTFVSQNKNAYSQEIRTRVLFQIQNYLRS